MRARPAVRLTTAPATRLSSSSARSTRLIGRTQYLVVGRAKKVEVAYVDSVMTACRQDVSNPLGQRFVDQEPHPAVCSGSSRSSTAAAA